MKQPWHVYTVSEFTAFKKTEKQSALIKYRLFCQAVCAFENKHGGVVLLKAC